MASGHNPSENRHSIPSLASITVLLVEDEPDMAQLLTLVLEEAGANVIQVIEAEDALSLIEHNPPDLLLSNIKLPRRDGTWLVQQLRSHPSPRLKQLPAIAVTSYTRDFSINAALKAGFNRFLPKHENFNDLIEAIAELVKGQK